MIEDSATYLNYPKTYVTFTHIAICLLSNLIRGAIDCPLTGVKILKNCLL